MHVFGILMNFTTYKKISWREMFDIFKFRNKQLIRSFVLKFQTFIQANTF